MARIDEIAPDLYRVSIYVPQFDLQFNHFLIKDDEPLLFHTGMRRMCPEVRDAVARLIDPAALRWISWSHFEVDECGALNEWLAVAPRAQAICSQVGAAVNIEDFADRPPRGLAKDDVIETGQHRYRFVPTPHLPHGWDAGVLFEEKLGVLLCSDLFHQLGDVEPVTSADVLGRWDAAVAAYQMHPVLMDYVPLTPATRRRLNELADLQPRGGFGAASFSDPIGSVTARKYAAARGSPTSRHRILSLPVSTRVAIDCYNQRPGSDDMKTRIMWTMTAAALAITASAPLGWLTRPAGAQTGREAPWGERTPWGDPDLQGEWTSEGEYGVPFERPLQFGTRQFLTDEEYAKRLEEVRIRDERDLARVDVLSGKVDAPNAPIPHWREYNTTSRRTSLIIDPPDGRLPPRTPQARPIPVQRCGSLQRGEPCDSYEDYGLGVRCIVHGGGFPDAMFPAVYNANMRIIQSPGLVAISYELIHDTRVIALDASPQPAPLLSSAIRTHMGTARGRWEGATLVVESGNFRASTRGATPGLRLIERFTRIGRDAIQYRVTFIDPATWTAPWTAALDLEARPADSGVFEYACHEGNYGMSNMLSAARHLERTAGESESRRPSPDRR